MQGLSSSLQEAKKAAQHLAGSLSNLHHKHHLREDYDKLLERARAVLKQIEQEAAHAPEAAHNALHKLHTANGFLAKALREAGSGSQSFLASMSSLTGRTPSHSESFKSAERLLSEALLELRSPGSIGSSSAALQPYDSASLAAQQSLLEAVGDAGPEQTGQLAQYRARMGGVLGNIAALALGPGPAGTVGNLCVAVNGSRAVYLGVYVGCREKQHKEHSLDMPRVECMVCDAGSNTVWTGHADGTIRVHHIRDAATDAAAPEWNVATATCCKDVAVSSLAIQVQDQAASPRCWAGSAQGCVFVYQLTLMGSQQQLLLKKTVLPGVFQMNPPNYLQVDAMLHLGCHMLMSGGYQRPADPQKVYRLQLADCKTMSSVGEFVSRCGAVTCLEHLAKPFVMPMQSSRQPASSTEGMTSASSVHSSMDRGGSGSSSACRVLSGHAHGQVVLWELSGMGAAATLTELAVIGEHSSGRVVKGIFAFPAWDMLVVATSSQGHFNLGKLRVMHLPSAADLAGADSKKAQGMARPHKVPQPTVELQTYVHQAHTQQILATTRQGEAFVTASTSSIRFWSPKQLALQAAKGDRNKPGLTFSRTPRVSSSGSGLNPGRTVSDPDALLAVLVGRTDSASSGTSPFESQQQLLQQPSGSAPGAHQHAQPIQIPYGASSIQPDPRVPWFGSESSGTVQSLYPNPSALGFMSPQRATTPPLAGSSGLPSIPPLSGSMGATYYPQLRAAAHPGQGAAAAGAGVRGPSAALGPEHVALAAAAGATYAAGGMLGAQAAAQQPVSPGPYGGTGHRPVSPLAARQTYAQHNPMARQQPAVQQEEQQQQQQQQQPQQGSGRAAGTDAMGSPAGMPRPQHESAGSALLGAAPSGAAGERFDSASSAHRGNTQAKQTPVAGVAGPSASRAAPDAAAMGPAGSSAGTPPAQQAPGVKQSEAHQSGKGGKQQQVLGSQHSSDAVQLVQDQLQQEQQDAEAAQHRAADLQADLAAELASHGGYQFVRVLPDQSQYGSSRALQVRCSRTNRLRTLLQIPRGQLQQLSAQDPYGLQDLQEQLVAASDLHHPHMLQVQEVFLGPLHLNIVMEECSAGTLLGYPAKQASAWGLAPAGSGAAAGAAAAALSPELARWFLQQVVLAVDFYHTRIGNPTDGRPAGKHSKLCVSNTLLKVTPQLPQPVVKVPTAVLACGMDSVTLPADPASSKKGDNPFIAPEAYLSSAAGGARHDTPAGDVWACGVLLLKLLGGNLKPTAYSRSNSAGKAEDSQLFELPAQQRSKENDQQLRQLLSCMLQPQVGRRITLQRLQQHPWFRNGLPAQAGNMTERFIKASRACKQTPQGITAAVLAAAAGPQAPVRLMLQLKPGQRKPPAQQQKGADLVLLQGPVTPELQHGLHLQLHSLRQAWRQLCGITHAGLQGSSSACRATELLAAHQAALDSDSTFADMQRAVQWLRILQQRAWQAPQLRLYTQQEDRCLGMALLLQAACSNASYSMHALLQLLQGVQSPSLWRKLQSSVPARGKGAKGGTADPAAGKRLLHLIQLHMYVLIQARSAMLSLWVCRKVSAAVYAACTGRRRPARVAGRRPHVLAAVLGPEAAKLLAKNGPNTVAAGAALLLVQLQELLSCEQQGWQRSRVPVEFVKHLEDLSSVVVSKQPLLGKQPGSSGGTAGSCVVYSGALPQQGGQKVLVLGLTGADVSQGLPAKRIKELVQRLQTRLTGPVDDAYICVLCFEVMTDPVNASDGNTYCSKCLENWVRERQAAGQAVNSPLFGGESTCTVQSCSLHLKRNLEALRSRMAQNQKLAQQEVVQQVEQRQRQWDQAQAGQKFKASEHMGLAHAGEARSSDAVDALKQVLQRLQDLKALSGSNTGNNGAAAGNSSSSGMQQQVLRPLAPIHSVCLDPPLLVVPEPPGGTLEQWISSTESTCKAAGTGDFSTAWVGRVPWQLVLQLLRDAAAALCTLHQQQPAVVHGGVHAAAIHLLQQLPDGAASEQQQQPGEGVGRLAQLSLSSLLAQLSPLSSCHPFLCAPEVLLASGPVTTAADVYGFGVLLFQLATGWLPQQYTPGTDEQICAGMWCRDMMSHAGSTSPLAAAQRLAAQQAGKVKLATGEWTPYGKHLPSAAALEGLPAGYLTLMEQCLHRVALARLCMHDVAARLAGMTCLKLEQ